MKADIILIDTRSESFVPLVSANWDQLISHLVFAADGRNVHTSIVNGRVVLRDRRLETIDENRILAMANEAFANVLARI
jgi:5-methylthioadenosine/S-adenosylhomocysteine deaminase